MPIHEALFIPQEIQPFQLYSGIEELLSIVNLWFVEQNIKQEITLHIGPKPIQGEYALGQRGVRVYWTIGIYIYTYIHNYLYTQRTCIHVGTTMDNSIVPLCAMCACYK